MSELPPKIPLSLSRDQKLVIQPCLFLLTEYRKMFYKTVYSVFFRRYFSIRSSVRSYPVILPELLSLCLLDLTGANLQRRFYALTTNFEGLSSQTPDLLHVQITRHDSEQNRILTYGRIDKILLPSEVYASYIWSIRMQLTMTSSFMIDSPSGIVLCSPTRWFIFRSDQPYEPAKYLTYFNHAVLYLTNDDLRRGKKIRKFGWDFVQTKALFVYLRRFYDLPNLKVVPLYLLVEDEMHQELLTLLSDESRGLYITAQVTTLINSKDVYNILVAFFPLIQSKIFLLPLLLSNFAVTLYEPVLRLKIPHTWFQHIFARMLKFTHAQTESIVKSLEEQEHPDRLLRFDFSARDFSSVDLVNPLLIPELIRRAYIAEKSIYTDTYRAILEGNTLDALTELQQAAREQGSFRGAPTLRTQHLYQSLVGSLKRTSDMINNVSKLCHQGKGWHVSG